MNDFQKQELIDRHFGWERGSSMVKTSLVRMYTQLPDFNTDVAGLYAFLRSWRNSKEDSDMHHAVWHSKDYLYAQSGLGRKAFASRLEVLERYNLVTVKKSPIIPNKDVIYVHDPLTRDEFAKAHPKVVDEFIQKAVGIEARNLEYRLSELLKIEQKAEREADS